MNHWILHSELHANTRRTRITLRGHLDGEEVALKCYQAPLYGLWHWWRSHRKAIVLRQRNIPLPEVLFSGWLPEQRCFCIAYRFLDRHERLQERLRTPDPEQRWSDVQRLIRLFVHCHRQGVMQTDANLTNFLISPDNQWVILDLDDIQCVRGPLREKAVLFNLAAAIRRVPGLSEEEIPRIWRSYIDQGGLAGEDSLPRFRHWLRFWDQRLAGKIRKRRHN